MEIAILAGYGLGDFIVRIPQIIKLKKEFPNDHITIVTRKPGLWSNYKDINNVISLGSVTDYIKIVNKRFDLLILGCPTNKLSHFLFCTLKANKKIEYVRNKKEKNMVEMHLGVLKQLGMELTKEDYKLKWPLYPKRYNRRVNKTLRGCNKNKKILIIIHAGARKGYSTRFWPAKRWAKIVGFLIDKYKTKIILVGGKDDIKETKSLIEVIKHPITNLVNKLSMEELTDLLKKCNLFISTNSGPMWLAAALHKPQIALCGPSKFEWEPYNDKAILIRKIINRKYCNPPCDAKTCKYKDNLCMKSIKTKEVIEAIKRQIKNVKNN